MAEMTPTPPAGTPRTDEREIVLKSGHGPILAVPADFARTLERELAASQAEVERLREVALAAQEYAQRYLCDEAEDVAFCFDDAQHQRAKRLFAALQAALAKGAKPSA